jgi:hypothetical protein
MTPAELAKMLLPGVVQVVTAGIDYALGLARTAGLSEEQARAELAPLYARLQARADKVEAAPVFDPDKPPDPAPTV